MSTSPTTASLPLAPGRWPVDTNHSSIGFTIRHLGVSKVRGRFTRFDADVVIGDTLDATTVTATIDMASIDTANADRDAHVLSPDIIDVAKRPTMAFRSTRVAGAGSEFRIDGELTIGDITRPIVLAAEFGGLESFPGGGPRHAGFEATTEIRRKDFGIDLAMPPGVSGVVLGDVVKVELDLQLLEPGADRRRGREQRRAHEREEILAAGRVVEGLVRREIAEGGDRLVDPLLLVRRDVLLNQPAGLLGHGAEVDRLPASPPRSRSRSSSSSLRRPRPGRRGCGRGTLAPVELEGGERVERGRPR